MSILHQCQKCQQMSANSALPFQGHQGLLQYWQGSTLNYLKRILHFKNITFKSSYNWFKINIHRQLRLPRS